MADHEVKKITFDNQGESITAYVSMPKQDGPHPAVIVLSAIAGINDYVKDITTRLSDEGFLGLAIDIYSREGSAPDISSPEKVMQAVANLPDQRVVSDTIAAVQHLKGRDYVKKDGIGVLGFCIGGTHSMLTACETDEIQAAVDFYGLIKYAQTSPNKPHSPIDRVCDLKAPLLTHFGEFDRLISKSDIEEMTATLNEHHKVYELFTYRGAPHAFHEDFRKEVYRPVAAHLAWQRSIKFLQWYLEGKR
jgi:carboxymethylenebutenolidase